jgi:hypothetical protein
MKQINNGLHTGTVLQVLVPPLVKQAVPKFTDPEHWYNPGQNREAHRKCMVPVCRVYRLVYVKIVQISSPVVFVYFEGGVAHPRDQLFTSATNKNLVLIKFCGYGLFFFKIYFLF